MGVADSDGMAERTHNIHMLHAMTYVQHTTK